MKTLLVFRHAKSSWDDQSLADHDRPLNERGKRDAPRIGRLLRELGLKPDAVLSSTAKRARKTARKAIGASGYDVEVQLLGELYLADAATIIRVLNRQPDSCDTILLVGHNPGLEALVHWFTGQDSSLPTAAMAHIDLPLEHWQELSSSSRGTLHRVWLPKELDERP